MIKKRLIISASVILMVTLSACGTTRAADRARLLNEAEDDRGKIALRDNCEPADEDGFYYCTREALETAYNDLTNKEYSLRICDIDKRANNRKYLACEADRKNSILNKALLWTLVGLIGGFVGGATIGR